MLLNTKIQPGHYIKHISFTHYFYIHHLYSGQKFTYHTIKYDCFYNEYFDGNKLKYFLAVINKFYKFWKTKGDRWLGSIIFFKNNN